MDTARAPWWEPSSTPRLLPAAERPLLPADIPPHLEVQHVLLDATDGGAGMVFVEATDGTRLMTYLRHPMTKPALRAVVGWLVATFPACSVFCHDRQACVIPSLGPFSMRGRSVYVGDKMMIPAPPIWMAMMVQGWLPNEATVHTATPATPTTAAPATPTTATPATPTASAPAIEAPLTRAGTDDRCPMCMEDFDRRAGYIIGPCAHRSCAACTDATKAWTADHGCPLCRTPTTSSRARSGANTITAGTVPSGRRPDPPEGAYAPSFMTQQELQQFILSNPYFSTLEARARLGHGPVWWRP